ncbi:hypothetical protein SAMN06295937_101553 [Sphingopyxis flava]|uniref:Uncharacterized protein n=1 Tax=Sphingopyxis flava TaxID=1507287 RepID=A0A1T5DM86_9SPHN|nr:hypothetical protein SAMN06295937_101553 [Sphingopyxis flava]
MRLGLGAEAQRSQPEAAHAAGLLPPTTESPPFDRRGVPVAWGRALQQTQRGFGFGFHFFLATWRLRTGTVS